MNRYILGTLPRRQVDNPMVPRRWPQHCLGACFTPHDLWRGLLRNDKGHRFDLLHNSTQAAKPY